MKLTRVVRPRLIDDQLLNPGIGFMTFQRFNGDELNQGKTWTEGFPIEYQPYRGTLHNPDHPDTTLAYFRIYWKFLEEEEGVYNWAMIDKALATARERKQTLLLRIAPYGTNEKEDVPAWYRKMVGPYNNPDYPYWMVDPNDPRYAECFGRFIRALGQRYNGHPDLESVDLAISSSWGEGHSVDSVLPEVREKIIAAYTETFTDTPLLALVSDKVTAFLERNHANVGFRADCLGDMREGDDFTADHRIFNGDWNHMLDYYPIKIIEMGMKDDWKKAPVSFEICWVLRHWEDEGWDIDYIIEQSLKWHISSFNAKSSPVPEKYKEKVDNWLKRMGYRLALRRFTFPNEIKPGERLHFESWWENRGVAPCYKKFKFAIRLKNDAHTEVFVTDANIIDWLPGDSLYNNSFVLPADLPEGDYDVEVALVDPNDLTPRVKLANTGLLEDGWYELAPIHVKK